MPDFVLPPATRRNAPDPTAAPCAPDRAPPCPRRRPQRGRAAGAALGVALLATALTPAPGLAASTTPPAPGDGVATLPAAAAETPLTIDALPPFRQAALRFAGREMQAALQARDQVGAITALARLQRMEPRLVDLQALMARLYAEVGAPASALRELRRAADLGWWNAQALEDPVFAPLRTLPEYPEIAARIAAASPPVRDEAKADPAPRLIEDGVALVDEANSWWDRGADALITRFALPEGPAPAVAANPDLPGAETLNARVAAGEAAGNRGDFYDNRDEGHSPLRTRNIPNIAHIAYGPEARKRKLQRGLKQDHDFGGPTIGNSSTAITSGPFWRSLPRLALTDPGGAMTLYRQYRRNQLYVYPEHKDHDPFFGDLLPAQTPYLLISQGSSGSDRPLLRGLAMALAALQPEVKRMLTDRGLIAPTLQMLIRRSMEGVESDADYLSGRAHPAVFEAETLDLERLVARAGALRADEVPPPATLQMLAESIADPQIEIFADRMSERLFDTPHAIGRVARGAYGVREFRLSAAGTADPNGRPLRFHWKVLSEGAADVTIEPLDEAGTQVRIFVPWQESMIAPGPQGLRTRRLDIMAVADNGAQLGAPAFLSVLFPARRVVRFDGEKPVTVIYDAMSRLDEYQDPQIFPQRLWSDEYRYDAEGRLLGWTRTHRDGPVERFTRHGARVETVDAEGRPKRARAMAYPTTMAAGGLNRILPTPLDLTLEYTYEGPEDRLGAAAPVASGG